jgi:hypothetical protein
LLEIVECCAFKKWFILEVVATFLIKTIMHWPPLYVSRSCSYFVLKLLPMKNTANILTTNKGSNKANAFGKTIMQNENTG